MAVEFHYVRMTTSGTERRTWVPALTFAAKLALIRHKMGWNIKEAALACGLPPQSWRGWELQRRLPHDIRRVARLIAERTSVDLDWLLEPDEVNEDEPMVRYLEPTESMSAATRRPRDNRPPGRNQGVASPLTGRTYRLPRP